MKFIKVETGLGGWDEYTDTGQFVHHLTNAEHSIVVQQLVKDHAHTWFVAHGMPVDPSQWAGGVGHKLYGKIYNAIDSAINAHLDLPVELSIQRAVTSIDKTFNSALPLNPAPSDIYAPILKAGIHDIADPFIQTGYQIASGLHHVTSLLLWVGGTP